MISSVLNLHLIFWTNTFFKSNLVFCYFIFYTKINYELTNYNANNSDIIMVHINDQNNEIEYLF